MLKKIEFLFGIKLVDIEKLTIKDENPNITLDIFENLNYCNKDYINRLTNSLLVLIVPHGSENIPSYLLSIPIYLKFKKSTLNFLFDTIIEFYKNLNTKNKNICERFKNYDSVCVFIIKILEKIKIICDEDKENKFLMMIIKDILNITCLYKETLQENNIEVWIKLISIIFQILSNSKIELCKKGGAKIIKKGGSFFNFEELRKIALEKLIKYVKPYISNIIKDLSVDDFEAFVLFLNCFDNKIKIVETIITKYLINYSEFSKKNQNKSDNIIKIFYELLEDENIIINIFKFKNLLENKTYKNSIINLLFNLIKEKVLITFVKPKNSNIKNEELTIFEYNGSEYKHIYIYLLEKINILEAMCRENNEHFIKFINYILDVIHAYTSYVKKEWQNWLFLGSVIIDLFNNIDCNDNVFYNAQNNNNVFYNAQESFRNNKLLLKNI